MIRAGYGAGHFPHGKEGSTQGNPWAMIAYGLGILPLIRYLQMVQPRVTKTWYADDAGAGGTFTGIQQYIDNLMVRSSLWGYIPKPTKSIFVVSP